MEFYWSDRVSEIDAHEILRNCSCQRNWRPWNSREFHGIPWNCSCQWNWLTRNSTESHGTVRGSEIDTPCSMEFHGPDRVIEIDAHEIQFHATPWNSMEMLMIAKLAHSKFHGIPWNSWNCWGQRNWRTLNSTEFHRIPWNCSCQRNWHPSNSTEFPGIPWNCSCHRNGALQGSM